LKWLIIVLCIIATSIISFFAFLIISDLKEISSQESANSSLEEIREATGGTISEEQLKVYEEKGLNPFGQRTSLN
jgi:hypothetical protein